MVSTLDEIVALSKPGIKMLHIWLGYTSYIKLVHKEVLFLTGMLTH